MPHTYPKRRFRPNELLAPDILTETFQDASMKFAGRLNEQDFAAADIKAKVGVAAEAYYDAHHVVRGTAPGWNRGGGSFYADIDGNSGDVTATISDSDGWQALVDDGGTNALALTMTCGEGDVLVMFGQMQHAAWKGEDTDVAAELGSPLRLQYAFRLDGVVLDNSITGAAIYPDPPPQAWYRAEAYSSAADFDYRHIQYMQGTVGISPAVHPARITYTAPVASGSRYVEVVARRLPPHEYKVDNTTEGATVQVFNRRLFVLRIKGMSPHSGDAPSVSIAAFEDGQVLDAADITTNAFDVLATAANNVDNGHIERGAFRNEHLPSRIYGPVAYAITPASATAAITGEYPGYGTESTAWTTVTESGDDLIINGPTASSEWDLETNPGTFVVIANVQVKDIVWTGTSAPSASQYAIGCFALRVTNSAGTATVIGNTEVYVNGHVFNNEASPDAENLDDDVPLMWVVDSYDLSGDDLKISSVEVVASVWDGAAGTSPPDVAMRTQRGNIFGFVLRDVHT